MYDPTSGFPSFQFIRNILANNEVGRAVVITFIHPNWPLSQQDINKYTKRNHVDSRVSYYVDGFSDNNVHIGEFRPARTGKLYVCHA